MGVVIRRWVWLETIGVVSGCFLHITRVHVVILDCTIRTKNEKRSRDVTAKKNRYKCSSF